MISTRQRHVGSGCVELVLARQSRLQSAYSKKCAFFLTSNSHRFCYNISMNPDDDSSQSDSPAPPPPQTTPPVPPPQAESPAPIEIATDTPVETPVATPPVSLADTPQQSVPDAPVETNTSDSPVTASVPVESPPAPTTVSEDPPSVTEPSPGPQSVVESVTPSVSVPIVPSSVSAPVVPVPSVSGAAPQSPSAWNPHSAEEINYVKTVLGPKAWASHRIHMQERLDKLMEFARKKGTIDRTDVRLHLEVSAPTATRYLTALVQEGKLIRRHTQDDNVYTVA